jgi:hypothetical protein
MSVSSQKEAVAAISALQVSLHPAQDDLDAALELALPLLSARDDALARITLSFSVARTLRGDTLATPWLDGRLWRYNSKCRLELTDHASHHDQIMTWDGRLFIRATTPHSPTAEPVVDQQLSPEGAFTNGAYPLSFGLELLGRPIAQLLTRDYCPVVLGRQQLGDRSCLEVLLLYSETTRIPVARLLLDDHQTLLVWLTETLAIAAESDSSHALQFEQKSYDAMLRWTLLEATERDGVWLPLRGTQEAPGFPQARQVSNHMTIEEPSIQLGHACEDSVSFRHEIPIGTHVRDLDTGRIDLHGTQNHEGLTLQRLESLVAAMAASDGVPPSVEYPDDGWLDMSCGNVAVYMYSRLLGCDIDIDAVMSRLNAGEGTSLSLLQLRTAITELVSPVQCVRLDAGLLSRLQGHYIIVRLPQDRSANGAHFVVARPVAEGLRIVDPHEGLLTVRAEALHDTLGTVEVVIPEGAMVLLDSKSQHPAYWLSAIAVAAVILLVTAVRCWRGSLWRRPA